MPLIADLGHRLRAPNGPLVRWSVAVAVVAAATLLRVAVDPLIHDQIPYFIYVASVVVATWFGGVDGGILSAVVAAFVGNYLFVPPRYEFVPHGEDWVAMALFALVALGLVAIVGRLRRTHFELQRLHRRMAAVLEQMPVGVMLVDAQGVIQLRNSAFDRLLAMPSRVGQSLADFRAERAYETRRVLDGREVLTDERPLSRALRGETVRDEEIRLVQQDGTRRILSTSSAPVLAEDGQIAGAVVAITDTTDRVRIEAELLQREQQLRAATLAAEVGVWTWCPSTGSVSVGANWRGLFDVPADAPVTFETWVAALHPDDRDRAVETLQRAWGRHDQFDVEYRIVRRDGSIRWLIDRARTAHEPGGQPTGMAGISIDITERKLAEEALRDANRVKDEFLATLSHELRTPLNAIVGWSDLLRRGALHPRDLVRATDSIYRNAKVQSELINDVLDVSRIISGKVRIDVQPVDPVQVLGNAVEALRPAAEAKGITLSTACDVVPYAISADATRLQQVFWNLLSNAVKFTPEGGTVAASSCLVGGQLRVQVTDTGIGISPAFLPHVFERFRQRDSSSTRQHSGLGIGLAIVKHLVELHGGTVTAESAGEGKGATFTITIPAQPFAERRHEERPAGRRARPVEQVLDDVPALCGTRVLVVDDERDARELAASVLGHHGATVAIAATASQALDQLALFDPHVLLIDLAMPDTDGYALLDRIRKASGTKGPTVPAIAFTAYAREEDQRRALASGFHSHLAKPVDSHALVRAVALARRP